MSETTTQGEISQEAARQMLAALLGATDSIRAGAAYAAAEGHWHTAKEALEALANVRAAIAAAEAR